VTDESREGCRGGYLVARYAQSTHPDSINSSIQYYLCEINGLSYLAIRRLQFEHGGLLCHIVYDVWLLKRFC